MQKAGEVSSTRRGGVAQKSEQQLQDAPNGRRSEGKFAGIRVLVIDDERDSRLVMEMFFRLRGATVRTAPSASEGRRMLEIFKPHLIVSDIAMPGEDGNQFLQSIRALPIDRGGRTPAIAMTAFAYPEDRRRALESGFNVHLAKPANFEELFQAVHDLTATAES
ncbi:response regulator [Pendulispora rubella]|uniref:Response regulator n=1 Tax=Pendulispora rubella TaxID=2741070 RepID=A0ABZ2LB80_9BACT